MFYRILCWVIPKYFVKKMSFSFYSKIGLSFSSIYPSNLYHCRFTDSYFIQVGKISNCHLLGYSNRTRLGQWELTEDKPCVLLLCPHHSLSIALVCRTRCSCLTFYFPYPSPRINCFSRKPRSIKWRIACRSQILQASYVYSFWDIFASGPLSR